MDQLARYGREEPDDDPADHVHRFPFGRSSQSSRRCSLPQGLTVEALIERKLATPVSCIAQSS